MAGETLTDWSMNSHRRRDLHAADLKNIANERDDTVLMTCSPQGKVKVIDYYLKHKHIFSSKDSRSQLWLSHTRAD